jgi:anti-sigma factor RsiW
MSMFTNAGHVSQDALSLHALDDLPVSWVIPVEQHLSTCDHCQVEKKEVEEVIAALRRLARPSPPLDRSTPIVN